MSVWITRLEGGAAGRRLAVKDLFDTAGVRTTYGSAIFADHVPSASAAAVIALEAAGWTTVGKANLHEFAYGITSDNPHYGLVPNPSAPGRIAGGSSGGNAAALVLGEADGALGTDSGGSIRIPAACCGIVGFKPTWGLVSLDGCFPLAPSYDHAGPMARDVGTCEALLGALVPSFVPAAEIDLADVHAGVAWTELADPLVGERVRAVAGLFGRVSEIDLPLTDPAVFPLFGREAAEVHEALFAERAADYGENVRQKLEWARAVTDAQARDAAVARERYREQVATVAARVDVVLTPTLAMVAPPVAPELELRDGILQFTYPFNATGAPALALPAGPAEDGLPASVQVVGSPGKDAAVLAVGRALEHAVAG